MRMPEGFSKIPQSASPVARAGGGDISERELSRERSSLQTPPTRSQPVHPKKQLFSTPVNKFTARSCAGQPSPNLARLRSCLEEFRARTPARPVQTRPKAVSMEDLTPVKRIRNERNEGLETLRSPATRTLAEEQAAMKVYKFLVVTAWRRRRDEVRCLRKTLEFQVSSSERLRIQVSTLKSLLDSDNAKVRLAMRELDRLKQLLRDRDIEKALLEREKLALERDVCAAEDQASEMSIGWRNCRNELEGVRAAGAACERALALERAAAAEARSHRDHAYRRLSMMEEELSQHETALASAAEEAAALRREADERRRQLDAANEQLLLEQEARCASARECASLGARVAAAAEDTRSLRATVGHLQEELQNLARQLASTREQLDWWPRPLTKMLGAARSWLRHPMSFPEAVLWTLVPARHGC